MFASDAISFCYLKKRYHSLWGTKTPRGAVGGKRVECSTDPFERDPGGVAGLDQRDRTKDGAVVAALVPLVRRAAISPGAS
jgi:hypothetical protein